MKDVYHEKCVPKVGLNICTRGSRRFAPSKLLPAAEAQPSISECHAIGAGLKLVTNKVGHDP